MRLTESLVTAHMDPIHLLLGNQSAKDATLTIDFGRSIQTDRVNLCFEEIIHMIAIGQKFLFVFLMEKQ